LWVQLKLHRQEFVVVVVAIIIIIIIITLVINSSLYPSHSKFLRRCIVY
jgi:hypothetical protein